MRLIRRYYIFQFLFSMLFWAPIFFEFQKRLGLSDGEIFRIQSLYYLAFCFLEIPTGFFAERLHILTRDLMKRRGRRKCALNLLIQILL